MGQNAPMKDLGQGGHTQQRHKSHNPREPIILSWRNPKFSLSANQTLPPLFPIIRKWVKSLVQVTNFQKSMAAVLSYCFHFPVFSLLHWLYKVFASLLFVLPIALAVKNYPSMQADIKRRGFDPWVGKIPKLGRSPGGKHGQPTPVSLPGESHGQRILAGYSPWGPKTQHAYIPEFHWNPSNSKHIILIINLNRKKISILKGYECSYKVDQLLFTNIQLKGIHFVLTNILSFHLHSYFTCTKFVFYCSSVTLKINGKKLFTKAQKFKKKISEHYYSEK